MADVAVGETAQQKRLNRLRHHHNNNNNNVNKAENVEDPEEQEDETDFRTLDPQPPPAPLAATRESSIMERYGSQIHVWDPLAGSQKMARGISRVNDNMQIISQVRDQVEQDFSQAGVILHSPDISPPPSAGSRSRSSGGEEDPDSPLPPGGPNHPTCFKQFMDYGIETPLSTFMLPDITRYPGGIILWIDYGSTGF